jgi:hypothetical protein
MLGYVARQQPSPETFSLFSMGDALMPESIPAEAHCQEDRGINADDYKKSENV